MLERGQAHLQVKNRTNVLERARGSRKSSSIRKDSSGGEALNLGGYGYEKKKAWKMR